MKLFFLLMLFFWTAQPAHSMEMPTLSLHGQIRQGEMLFGHVAPESKVTLNGEQISPRSDGWFAFGIGRNDTDPLVFNIEQGDRKATYSFQIEPREWRVQRVDGLPQNTVTPSPEEEQRIADEMVLTQNARQKSIDMELPLCFSMPAKGRISSIYGSQRILNGVPKTPHNALDIANKEGTLITAPADGIVLLVHEDMFLSGKTVLIGHGQNVVTSYIHMSKIAVKEGQQIKKGDEIGRIGMTGRATGPHLHWVVSWKMKRVDPQVFLKNSEKFCSVQAKGPASVSQKAKR
ncbi:MAG: M23 family metallopeptidase [Alphaproteobacteria bacterium]|nr:M23 family metallopeptidase [Alphaproteobacteria bacterium]